MNKRVLFVCSGNTCRSPMAEYLARHRMPAELGWEFASAGAFTLPGMAASEYASEALRELHIDAREHRSDLLHAAAIDAARWIVVMGHSHREAALHLAPEAAPRIRLLTEFGGRRPPQEILDPAGGSLAVYRTIRDQIDGALADLLLFLRDDASPHN